MSRELFMPRFQLHSNLLPLREERPQQRTRLRINISANAAAGGGTGRRFVEVLGVSDHQGQENKDPPRNQPPFYGSHL